MTKKENKFSSQYRYLETGEKIQKGDEYNANLGVWRVVPNFLIGDIVPDVPGSTTQWRRYTQQKLIKKPKKKWFSFLFGK